MTKINSIADMKDEIAGYRRSMHENPQTAYEEEFASGLVAEKLAEWGVHYERGIAKTGIVAVIEGQKMDSGKAIGIRADMDALDIIEQSGQPWASKTKGKMHGCGHDGHTAMLLGAAKYLNETRNFDGKVYLIFQPAEEGERGADQMIEEGLFDKFPMDEVYALHNWPYLPVGKIGLRKGPIMANVDIFDIKITGNGGHAAIPQNTCDPVVIAAQIVTALQSIVSRNVDPVDTAVLSVTNMNSGTGAFNVIPDTATLNGTVRSFKNETSQMIEKRMNEIVQNICAAFGAKAEVDFRRINDATVNHDAQTDLCAEIACELLGEDNVDLDIDPSMGGEDFGSMLLEKPGCYFALGQGTNDPKSPHNHGLHNPGYDFNDDIIPVGIEFWARLAEKALPLDK